MKGKQTYFTVLFTSTTTRSQCIFQEPGTRFESKLLASLTDTYDFEVFDAWSQLVFECLTHEICHICEIWFVSL